MTIGTGIFLSTLFIGLIYLFIKTKDSWNWIRIIKWVGISVISLIFLLVAVVYGIDFFESKKFNNKLGLNLGVVQTLEGVTIGDRLSDTQFKIPSSRRKESVESDSIDFVFDNDKSKTFAVDKITNKVKNVTVFCTDDAYNYPNLYSFKIHGIMCKTPGSDIFSLYGRENVRVMCRYSDEKKTDSLIPSLRAYDIVKYGVRFVLQHDAVVAALIFSPEDLSGMHGVHWKPCN